jgi:hypothetical protein
MSNKSPRNEEALRHHPDLVDVWEHVRTVLMANKPLWDKIYRHWRTDVVLSAIPIVV